MATSGIDGHRPGGAEAGGRKEVFRHRWRTRSTKGRRRARRPEAGRGRGGERCTAAAAQAARDRQPATASGAARAAATAGAITDGPPVRPGRVPRARCGGAATARRRSRGVGRRTRGRPTTAGRRAAASPRTRGRRQQDDGVHARQSAPSSAGGTAGCAGVRSLRLQLRERCEDLKGSRVGALASVLPQRLRGGLSPGSHKGRTGCRRRRSASAGLRLVGLVLDLPAWTGSRRGRREGGGSVFVLGAEFPVPGFEGVAVGPGGVVPAVLPAVGLHPVELDGT